jgi:hypothetical protein
MLAAHAHPTACTYHRKYISPHFMLPNVYSIVVYIKMNYVLLLSTLNMYMYAPVASIITRKSNKCWHGDFRVERHTIMSQKGNLGLFFEVSCPQVMLPNRAESAGPVDISRLLSKP